MEKYQQFGQICLDFTWGYLDVNLYMSSQVSLRNEKAIQMMLKVPFCHNRKTK